MNMKPLKPGVNSHSDRNIIDNQELKDLAGEWRSPNGILFVPIPAGTFTMGSPEMDDAICREITISTPFLLGKYPVTQVQWIRIMGTNPSGFPGRCHPVDNVSWDNCIEFIERINEIECEFGHDYRLPTEAEWEYACRARSTSRYCFGEHEDELSEYAWYGKNAEDRTHPVGQLKPNLWGLHDMHGNIWEWCHDAYSVYSISKRIDPRGPTKGGERVNRGGCWVSRPLRCESAYRICDGHQISGPYLGFRLLREL